MSASPQEAIAKILDLSEACTVVCKQTNFRHNGVTAKALNDERKATVALFVALVGRKPTEEELQAAIAG